MVWYEQIAALQAELSKERQHSREQAERIEVLADQAQRLQLAQMQPQQIEDCVAPAEPERQQPEPPRSWQSSRHEPAVKQLRQPLPFRGAKHFHTAAPMGWRCESAFALLSHQKVTKRLFLAEIYDKIEDGRISGKGAILWELRFRV